MLDEIEDAYLIERLEGYRQALIDAPKNMTKYGLIDAATASRRLLLACAIGHATIAQVEASQRFRDVENDQQPLFPDS